VISGDYVSYSGGTAAFADKIAALGKTVTGTGLVLTGADAGNYTVNSTAMTTANITQRPLTVTAAGVNKVYDGTTTATVTFSDNRIVGDSLTVSGTASFANKVVGTAKPVTVTGIGISGADAANYSLSNTTASTSANITARPLTVSATGVDKVYDGNSTATVALSDNRVAGDAFTDAYAAASFVNKNVGPAKAVSVSGISISGADAANYSLSNTTASATANITARALNVSAAGMNKVYDATTAATVTLSDNRVTGDVVTESYAAANFADPNVGNGKTVTVSGIAIAGADANNYSFNVTAATTASIAPRSTTATITSGNNPSLSGAPVTFTAKVLPQFGTTTGTVVFKDGTTVLGTSTIQLTGIATLTTSALTTVATHTITAAYSGDLNYITSTSPSLSEAISPSGIIQVKFERHELEDESNHPKVKTGNVAGAEVRIYTRRDSCADGLVSTNQPKMWGKVYDGLNGIVLPLSTPDSDSGCPIVTFGAYVAKGTTDVNGMVNIVVPPTTSSPNTDYVVIGRTCITDPASSPTCTEFDDPRTMDDPDALYSGKQVNNIKAGETRNVALKQLRLFNGKKVPAKYFEDYGSYLAIIEPEYMDWTSNVEQYPFVLEAIEGWDIVTAIVPPEGFVPDADALSATVADTVSAIQFTLTDVGSDWTQTQVTHTVKHKGKTITHKSQVPMFDKKPKNDKDDKDKKN